MDTVLASVLTVLQAAAFIIFPNVGGAVGSIVTGKQLKDWYLKLNKPPWTPPNWVFPPMWIFLYSCIGFASWIVFLHVGFQNVGMYLYAAQLALNWAWSPLFFGAHWVALAALDMMAMIGLSIACGIEFYQVNHVAGALIVPYLLWLTPGCAMSHLLANASAYLKPAAFVIAPHLGGAFGAIVTRNEIPVWYRRINKPPWTPPNWVFGPMWSFLYTSIGYSSWLIYKELGLQNKPMYLFGAQLALNWAWSPLFFGAHRVGLSVIDMVGMLGLAALCANEFRPVSQTAFRLMLPYLGWLSLALSINVYVWLNNDSKTLRGD
uniref:Translocator protein n=3 Tax=Macrostomum lignano TaxID=282301 RepID=A0A1I8IJY1_9PLAT